uniref:Uncharacterized protein n=1 Tax=Amphilophus citrinellus TaxID=61819 RepID=A0A3Q0SAZ4_AMPCI
MATGRKGSTSKAGGVHFPDDEEPPGSPTRRDDQSNLATLIAVLEKDGSYLVKAGFLKSHHRYEIVFTVPDVPTLGKELSCLPSFSPTRQSPSLRVQRIYSTVEVKQQHFGPVEANEEMTVVNLHTKNYNIPVLS